MARAVGIDLGVGSVVLAVSIDGRPEVLPAADGSRGTPPVLGFAEDGERLVGHPARRRAALDPAGTVHALPRWLGRRRDELDLDGVACDVVGGPDGAVRLSLRGGQYAPEELTAAVLRTVVDDASRTLGETVTAAVLTVPASCTAAQRRAVHDAARIAGLEVLRLLHEPTAAALAHGPDRNRHGTVLVVDLGAASFDVSVLEVGEGVAEVRATAGDDHLGGDDFDRRVVDHLAEEFATEHGVDPRTDPQARHRLLEAARTAKEELSAVARTTVTVPFLTGDASGPRHLHTSLLRSTFEHLTADLVARCGPLLERALSEARLTAAEIDHVVLAGGGTRIPAVRELVRGHVGGREPSGPVNADEVVALGAAAHAATLRGEARSLQLLDVLPLTVGIESAGGVMTPVIGRHTTLPARSREVVSTTEDDQPAVDVVVLQGERERAADNRVLGRFRLEGIAAAPRGTPRIEVTYDIDADGLLTVSARDPETDREQAITVSGTANLDPAEVDRMVREGREAREGGPGGEDGSGAGAPGGRAPR